MPGRILILCEFPTLLGGERSMLATLSGLAQRGFQVVVAGPQRGPLAGAVSHSPATYAEYAVRNERGRRRPEGELRADLAALAAAHDPSLIHGNSLAASIIIGPLAAELGLPVTGHARDIVKLGGESVRRLRLLARIVAVSQALAGNLRFLGVAEDRIRVVYNGIDFAEFRPRPPTGALHEELGLPLETPVALAVGQIILRKGWPILLDTWEIVTAANPDAHLAIVGERFSAKEETIELERQLHYRCHRPPLAGRVSLLGRRSDIPRLMNETAVLVHAAWQEPLGRVLLEAAASGLPAVVTGVGGTREIFPDEDFAWLAPPGNSAALAEGVLMTFENRAAAMARAENALRRAQMHFAHSQAVEGLAQVFEECAAGP